MCFASAVVVLSASAWVAQCDGSRIWCGSSKGEVVESCHALLAWERVEVGLHLVVLQNALKASWLEGNEADVQGGSGLAAGIRESSP